MGMNNRQRGKAWLMLILWIGSFSACLFRCLGSPGDCVEKPMPCCQAGEEAPTGSGGDESPRDSECPFCRSAVYAADGLQTPAVVPPVSTVHLDQVVFAADECRTAPACPSVLAAAGPPPGPAVPPASRWGHRARSQSPPPA